MLLASKQQLRPFVPSAGPSVFQKADAAVYALQFENMPWNLTGFQAPSPNTCFKKTVRYK